MVGISAIGNASAVLGADVGELERTEWMLICAALVMLMQAGFLCLETGLVRAKNSINVAIKNLVDFCVCAVVFWLFGYALMFGGDAHGVVGVSGWAYAADVRPISEVAFFLFQMMFCGTAATIISGAVAERMRFQGYLMVILLVSGLVYPLYGHWVWAGADSHCALGWLGRMGFVDFAGSTVVHGVGGWVSLAAVVVVGPRIGRFQNGGPGISGHNLPMAALGAMFLWVGWLGFNGGSTFELTERTGTILLNTVLAGGVGGVTLMVASWVVTRQPRAEYAINGVIAGLVGVTASCHAVTPPSAALIGVIAALVCYGATALLERLRIDDAVGAVPAHACAGAWGAIAVALFGDPARLGTGLGRWEQLGVQALGVVVCFAWSFGVGVALLWLVNRLAPLRVDREAEYIGLNMAEHGATTAILDLLGDMESQRRSGDFSRRVAVEPHTEVGQIAMQYNRVLEKVNQDTEQLVGAYDDIRQMNLDLRASRDREATALSEVQSRLDELQRFNRAAVGRELRMIDLKREVNELLAAQGRERRYDLSFGRTPGGDGLGGDGRPVMQGAGGAADHPAG